jgi:hypothetical protein
MPDATGAEYFLTVRLDHWVSDAALANEISSHICPLIARHCCCGDVVIGEGQPGWCPKS